MRRRKNMLRILTILVLALAVATTGCGGDDDAATEGGDEGGYSLDMIPKNVGNPVFDLTNAGMQEAAEELGDTTEFNGSTEADAQQQVEVINSAIAQSPDALLISRTTPTPSSRRYSRRRTRGSRRSRSTRT